MGALKCGVLGTQRVRGRVLEGGGVPGQGAAKGRSVFNSLWGGGEEGGDGALTQGNGLGEDFAFA